MEEKAILSIDPGSKGYLCLRYKDKFTFYAIEDYDLYQLSDIVANIRSMYANLICCIEEVRAIFGSAASATFSFGFNLGYLHGILAANKIPFVEVQPKIWQKCVWSNKDLVITYKKSVIKGKEVTRKVTDTKQTSINCAKRLFPNIDFRKNDRCSKIHDGKTDCILIGEYARRNNL